jgi:hypothetical protein
MDWMGWLILGNVVLAFVLWDARPSKARKREESMKRRWEWERDNPKPDPEFYPTVTRRLADQRKAASKDYFGSAKMCETMDENPYRDDDKR